MPSAPPPVRSASLRITPPVMSWREIRDRHVIKQQYDYSCGAAALATLMRHYFGEDVDERAILKNIIESMTEAEMKDREVNGLSLLDLKQCAERKGYQAVGVRLKLSALPKLLGPVLVHVDRQGNSHFAILRGTSGDRVYLADPGWGNLRMTADRFAAEWTGVALVLSKPSFGLPADHALALGEVETVENEMLAARRALIAVQ